MCNIYGTFVIIFFEIEKKKKFFRNLAESKNRIMRRITLQRCCLYFSSWSKKGYSIFCSIGREVRISRLALSMYENILLKSSHNGVIVNTAQTVELCPVLLELCGIEKISGEIRGEVCLTDSDRTIKIVR